MDKQKLILPICILLGCVILGWFLYAGLERQQTIKTAQDKQEYIGKRKIECYEIKEKEIKKNQGSSVAISAEYFEPTSNKFESKEFNDTCRLKYVFVGENNSYTEYVSY